MVQRNGLNAIWQDEYGVFLIFVYSVNKRPNLKDLIYYRTVWTVNLETGSTTVADYFVYYANTDRIASLKDSSTYENACYFIANGGLSGKIGNL